MKKILYAAALLLGLGAMMSCNKDKNDPENGIIGTWKVSTVEIYLNGNLIDKMCHPFQTVGYFIDNDGTKSKFIEDADYGYTYTFQEDGRIARGDMLLPYRLDGDKIYYTFLTGETLFGTYTDGTIREEVDRYILLSSVVGYEATDGTVHSLSIETDELTHIDVYTKQ